MEKELQEYILELTKKFSNIIPRGEQDAVNLVKEFKKYLENAVEIIKEMESPNVGKDVDSIKSILDITASNFLESDINYLKHELLEDKAFEIIREKSLNLYDIAQKKADKKAIDTKLNIEEEEEKIINLLDEVKDYNKNEAKQLVSEAILDAKYITTKNCDITSLRLGQYIRYMSEEER